MQDFLDFSALLGPGIYALVVRGEVIYVGKAKRLLSRIYAHKTNGRRTVSRSTFRDKPIYFTHIWVCPCKEIDLDRIEREMIHRYRPKENTNLVPKDRTLTLENSGFNFIVLGVDLRQSQIGVIERRF
jgi:excinuclease UvrABC nuclease subunit